MLTLHLPYPASNNRNARLGNGRLYTSPAVKKYKADIYWIAKCAGVILSREYITLSLVMHPKLTKSGKPSKVRLDLDNCFKVVLDALNGVAWMDDKQVIKLIAEVGEPINNGGLTVTIENSTKKAAWEW